MRGQLYRTNWCCQVRSQEASYYGIYYLPISKPFFCIRRCPSYSSVKTILNCITCNVICSITSNFYFRFWISLTSCNCFIANASLHRLRRSQCYCCSIIKHTISCTSYLYIISIRRNFIYKNCSISICCFSTICISCVGYFYFIRSFTC